MNQNSPPSISFQSNPATFIALAATTIISITISIICLSSGYFIIFQNLFYIPIIIACVYYTKRGLAFSVVIACIYFLLIVIFTRESARLLEALIRVLIFVLIAGITTYLSLARKRVEEVLLQQHGHLEGLVRERTAQLEEDITERKREEENLRRMATVVRDSNDAITIQDFEGRVTAWNRGAELMYGYSEEEALQKNIWLLTPPDKVEEQKEFTRRLIAGEMITSFETQRVTKDGRTLDVWLVLTKLMDDAGRPIGIASTERDITERKLAEEEIRQLNADLERRVEDRTAELEAANKELEAFSYSVSHDLRAPLRAIDGYATILMEDFPSQLGNEGKRLCSILSDNARKMGKLIDDLLTFSRLGRTGMQFSRIDMGTLANSIFHELTTPESRARIDFQVESAPQAFGDPMLIRQVWMNLLANAVKFSSKRERAVIIVRGEIREDEIIYSVQDNGAGFDIKYIDKLFGVFQRLHSTREFEGTGVGLAIVQRIIHRHGGRVWAEGKVGEGAVFYFAMPKKG